MGQPRNKHLQQMDEVISIARKIQTPLKPVGDETIVWRCTRDKQGGRVHPLTRQGYYVIAVTRDEAILRMRKRFPEDKFYGFTAQEWCPLAEWKRNE